MPLITCPDCGNQISDQAPSCVHCGRPAGPKPANRPTPSREEDVRRGTQSATTYSSGNLNRSAYEEPGSMPGGRGWDRVFKIVGMLLLLICGVPFILGIGLRLYGGAVYSSAVAQCDELQQEFNGAIGDLNHASEHLTFETFGNPDAHSAAEVAKARGAHDKARGAYDTLDAKCAEAGKRRDSAERVRDTGGGLIRYSWIGAIIALALLIAARYAPRTDSRTRGRS